MGLFDFFRRAPLDDQGAPGAALPKIRNLGAFDVVGESFYGSSFRKMSAQTSRSRGSESDVTVTLRADPSNRFSKSGKAVAVFVSGNHIGHVPETLAPVFFDKLQARGGAALAEGRIWIDDVTDDFTRCSVQVYSAIPPLFEDEEMPLGYQTSHSYYLKYSADTQKKIDELFAARLSEGVGECPGELKSAFLSFNDFDDRELMKSILASHKIEEMEIRAKGNSAQLMLVGDGELGESVHTSRALMHSSPILTISDFLTKYPNMSPDEIVLKARARFKPWRDNKVGSCGLLNLDNKQILTESRDGVFPVPGNCYRGSPSFRLGIFEEDGSQSENLKSAGTELWKSMGLQQLDSAVFTCNVTRKTSSNTSEIQFRGVTMAFTKRDNFDYFSYVRRSEKVLLQLNNLGGTSFTSSFELATWMIE